MEIGSDIDGIWVQKFGRPGRLVGSDEEAVRGAGSGYNDIRVRTKVPEISEILWK